MGLLDLVLNRGCRVVAVVGMAKNTGKTVTLNRLIEEAAPAGVSLGLTSVGRDGEERDILTRCPKPRIHVRPGMVAATAAETLATARAAWEELADTGIRTPLGNVLLVRMREEGVLEVAGPSGLTELVAVSRDMHRLGADLVLVDGAFGRLSTACPRLSDGLILATGAAYRREQEQVVQATAALVAQMGLTGPSEAVRRAAAPVIAARRVGLYDPASGSMSLLGASTSLGLTRAVAGAAVPGKVLVLGGAVVDSLLEALMERRSDLAGCPLIVGHSACILVEPQTWHRFVRAGGRFRVLEPAHLLAVTVNPWSPEGPSFPAAEFLGRVWDRVRPLPVFDVAARRSLGEEAFSG